MASTGTVDLILVYVPEGLPVLAISNPPGFVPPCYAKNTEFMDPVVAFASNFLQDDGAVIVIHPYFKEMRENILGYSVAFHFEVDKEWLGMNRLHLGSRVVSSMTVSTCYENTFILQPAFIHGFLFCDDFFAPNLPWLKY